MQKSTLLWLAAGVLVLVLVFSSGDFSMPTQTIYDKLAQAIMKFEGYFQGSLSFKNNNPGNLRDTNGQFLIFQTFQDGYAALVDKLRYDFSGLSKVYNASGSLYDFFAKYAPASDNNQPRQYAEFVAAQVGIDPNLKLSDIAQLV
jgi:hypothetical protein